MIAKGNNSRASASNEHTHILGIAWFRREQWDRLLEVSADRDDLEETFDEWVQWAQQHYDGLRRSGYNVTKIDVDVEELVRWCRQRGRPVDGEARSEFTVEKLQTGS